MKGSNKIFIVVLVYVFGNANAQDFPYQYFSYFNPMVNNPAFSAYDSEIRADVGVYNLWAGGFKPLNDYLVSFSMSPETKFKKTKRDTGYEKKIGLGAVFLKEEIGSISQNIFQLVYSYHFPVNRIWNLSFGICASMETFNIDLNSLSAINADDPRLMAASNSSILFDGGFGAVFGGSHYYVSFSVLNLASDNFKFENSPYWGINSYTKYYLSGVYDFELNYNTHFRPNITYRNSRTGKKYFDISMAFDFTFFNVGLGYRTENTLFLFTKIPYNNFYLTYNSENPLNSNHLVGNGHTFTVGWSFNSPKI